MGHFHLQKVNAVYLHNPKTAGMSVVNGAFSRAWVRGPDGPLADEIPEHWPMHRSFTTVREPFSRFVSGLNYCSYRWPGPKLQSFLHDTDRLLRFLENSAHRPLDSNKKPRLMIKHHLQLQSSPTLRLQEARIVMRFESLEEDFRMVCKAFDLGPRKLPIRNASRPNHHVKIEPEFIPRVMDYLRPDYETYGYKIP